MLLLPDELLVELEEAPSDGWKCNRDCCSWCGFFVSWDVLSNFLGCEDEDEEDAEDRCGCTIIRTQAAVGADGGEGGRAGGLPHRRG